MNGDFSNLKVPTSYLNDNNKMTELTLKMLPIIRTEKSLEDELFCDGFKLHMKMIRVMKEGNEVSDQDIDRCLDAYLESYEGNDIIEAMVNFLWWLVLIEIYMKNPWIENVTTAIYSKSFSPEEVYKKYYLKDLSEGSNDLKL